MPVKTRKERRSIAEWSTAGALVNGVCYYKEDLLPPEDTPNSDNGDPLVDSYRAADRWLERNVNYPLLETGSNVLDDIEEASEKIVCNPATPFVAGTVGFVIGGVSGVKQAALGDPMAPGRNAQAGWQSGIIMGQAAQQTC